MKRFLKSALKAVSGPKGYALVGSAWAWGRTLLNYWLFRLSRVIPFHIRAWPHALYVEGTNICNAECVFCAYPEMARPKKIMPMDLYRRLVDQYCAMGGGEVDVTPIVGDPFADAALFERLDYLAAKPKIKRFHFYTNGIAMRPGLGDRLLGYGARLCVNVSYGGFDRETYKKVMGVDKFDAVWPNLKHLIERKAAMASGLAIAVNLRTPESNNKGELFEYFKDCKRRGLIELTWMGAYDSWSGHIADEELRDAGLVPRSNPVKNGPCHRLLTTPVVLADGRVNACGCRDTEATLIIGDLNKKTLEEVLSGPALRDLIDAHARGDFPEACRKCTYYDSVYPGWWPGQEGRPDPSVPVPTDR